MRLTREEFKRMNEGKEECKKTFFFGDSKVESLEIMDIPCRIGERNIYIRTILVDGDIPWLVLSREGDPRKNGSYLGYGEAKNNLGKGGRLANGF
jgi:hypothetical protein